MKEWMASEIMDTEPLIIPAVSFNAMSRVFDNTDKLAAFVFLLISSLFQAKVIIHDEG